MRKIQKIFGILLFISAAIVLGVFVYYQTRLNSVNAMISTLEEHHAITIPHGLFEWQAELESIVSATGLSGGALMILAVVVLIKAFLVRSKLQRGAVLALLALFLAGPLIVPALAEDHPRWYAELVLQQPRNANVFNVDILYFQNYVMNETTPGLDPPLTAYSLFVQRIDPGSYSREWVEAGYFQNKSGFYLYSTYWTYPLGYFERDDPFSYVPGSFGQFSIVISGNHFKTYFGALSLLEVDLTISGDNYALLQGESSDPKNMMYGQFRFPKYSVDGNLYSWMNVERFQDAPYAGYAWNPSDRFIVFTPDLNRDGINDIKDLAIVAKSFGLHSFPYIADVNHDGKVDIKDLALVAIYFGKRI